MFHAPTRICNLTRAQRKVLVHIEMCRDSRQRLIQSTRQMADATGFDRRTIQTAIDRLNELGFIRTYAGSRTMASEHTLIRAVTGLVTSGGILEAPLLARRAAR